jgi:hypothetical protein
MLKAVQHSQALVYEEEPAVPRANTTLQDTYIVLPTRHMRAITAEPQSVCHSRHPSLEAASCTAHQHKPARHKPCMLVTIHHSGTCAPCRPI